MAKQYVRGPVPIYVGTGSSKAPQFFGTAERYPRISIRPQWSQVWNSFYGGKVPSDWIYQGAEAYVIADVTRWNQSVFAIMQNRPRHQSGAQAPGNNPAGDIGTAMIAEAFQLPLWLPFPYQAKAAYSDQPAGYHFHATWLIGPDDLDRNGADAAKIRCIWYCARIPTVNAASQGLDLALFDHTMAGLGPID